MIDKYERQKTEWNFQLLVKDSWSMGRPILPAPHQILEDLKKSLFERKITSKRSLVYHGGITISSTLVGFVMGGVLGILLAIGIVHVPTLNKSVLPWIIASQTIPILAVAPMIIVVLGAIGLTGLLPKAFISAYLSFFPIVIGMVKGLRSPDPMHLDLMKTYNATQPQKFWIKFWSKLRLDDWTIIEKADEGPKCALLEHKKSLKIFKTNSPWATILKHQDEQC